MLITPLPGTQRRDIRKTVRDVSTELHNTWTGHHGSAQAKLGAYLEWTILAVRQLSGRISPADVDRLVLTPAYGRLLAGLGAFAGTDMMTQRTLNDLVDLELQQRVKSFEDASRLLDEQIERWSRRGEFIVFDTSVFIEHEHKLQDMDLSLFLPEGQRFQEVHLLVPIVVVDELDGLKNKADKPFKRWRAANTLRVFDTLFADGTGPATLRPADPYPAQPGRPPAFEFSAEIVLDRPGHVRLPINDDELIDRTLAIEPLAGRRVKLVTYDTGQSTRARAAGLAVEKLTKPAGEEPSGR
jgi:hypothetical protein